MKWIVFMIANLLATTSFCAENQHDPWIDSFQRATQDPLFMANLGQEEIVVELMQQEDPNNSLFGQAAAQGLVTKASEALNGEAANQYLDQVGSSNGQINQEKRRLDASTEVNLSHSIGEMLKDGFLNGQKITLNPNEPILLHAKRLQNGLDSNEWEGVIPVDNYAYEEYVCHDNVHNFTEKVKESLQIEFEEVYEIKQDISLYAAAHNEFSVTITANLLSGAITSTGNGQNALHPSSRVEKPLGKIAQGSIVEFERRIPYEFWNGQTESVQVSLGTEPSQSNGYQYSFGLTQTNCNKKNKALCHQYRGMYHNWEATIFMAPVITGEQWVGSEKLQPFINKGLCKQIESHCLGMPESRHFGKGALALSVKKDCWERETTYQCVLGGQHQHGCEQYRSRGCEQTDAVCKETKNNICTLYEQRYRCPISNKSVLIDAKIDLEELSKDGYQLSFEKNNDFGEALSALSLATNFAKEQVTDDGLQGAFFGGQVGECEILPKQCCAQKGVIKKLFGCSEEEEALAPKVQNGVCHLIEETKKGIFHQKKRHYCCFNSKLARVVQVGARAQLGIDFGNGEAPNCRALSVAEIQRVDWSGVDFSEIAQDFAKKAQQTKITDAFKLQSLNSVNSNHGVAAKGLMIGINSKIDEFKKQAPNANDYYQEQLQGKQHG